MTIGERVKARRLELDLTPSELAERTKLSTGHIAEIEKGGRTNLQTSTLIKLSRGLGLSVEQLLAG